MAVVMVTERNYKLWKVEKSSDQRIETFAEIIVYS